MELHFWEINSFPASINQSFKCGIRKMTHLISLQAFLDSLLDYALNSEQIAGYKSIDIGYKVNLMKIA